MTPAGRAFREQRRIKQAAALCTHVTRRANHAWCCSIHASLPPPPLAPTTHGHTLRELMLRRPPGCLHRPAWAGMSRRMSRWGTQRRRRMLKWPTRTPRPAPPSLTRRAQGAAARCGGRGGQGHSKGAVVVVVAVAGGPGVGRPLLCSGRCASPTALPPQRSSIAGAWVASSPALVAVANDACSLAQVLSLLTSGRFRPGQWR